MTYIVAEMSCNHLGSLDRALNIVYAASISGADAVKIQTWTPELMVGSNKLTMRSGPWVGHNMAQLYREAWTPWEWHKPIMDYCHSLELEFFSTAFDIPALEFLESIGVRKHKISSFELVDLELIKAAYATHKPLVLSTGMASAEEIDRACAITEHEATLLHCVSAYPAKPQDMNLARIHHWIDYGYEVGISDHTLGIAIPAAAVAIGATYVEKHLTLSRADGGHDAKFSLEPEEFKQMAEACRDVYEAIGDGHMRKIKDEEPQREMRRSLWWDENLEPGCKVSRKHIKTCRPGYGLPPMRLNGIIGRQIARNVVADTPITDDDFV